MKVDLQPLVLPCGVTLYQGDCWDILPSLEIDAIISDPPYGVNYKPRKIGDNETRISATHFQGVGIEGDAEPFEPGLVLSMKKPCVLWGANHYANSLPPSPKWLVWDKRGHGYHGTNNFADCELAWCSEKGVARIHLQIWNGIVRQGEPAKKGTGRVHPTQKPIALMGWCMDEAKVPEGATVCDPYMGSGTTGIACIRTGRNFIGIEKDPEHFETARKRIEAELAQGDLFRQNARAMAQGAPESPEK